MDVSVGIFSMNTLIYKDARSFIRNEMAIYYYQYSVLYVETLVKSHLP